MISESIGLMTALDLIMIGMGATFFIVFDRNLARAGTKGFLSVGLGLGGFGLFYTADLFTMWVLPQLTSPAHSLAVMESLHLNYHWGFMLFGTACMLWGFGDVGRHLVDEIAERTKSGDALRESRERFELAAEGANDGMWDWPDMNKDEQWWSARWYALLGYADREIEASFSNFKAFLHPDDERKMVQAVTAHLEDRLPFEVDCRLRTKSGDYRWFRGRARSRPGREGKGLRISGSIQDITEQKRAEDEQLTLDARLRELEKLESLGGLARGFAHDFNNLLTRVMGNASFALMTLPPTSPLQPRMEAIEEAASHGAELTQQLLAYAGEGSGVSAQLDLSAFVDETSPLLAATVSRPIVLDYSLQPGLPPIVADPTQMRQILVNLVANAAHAIGAADGVITVSTGILRANDNRGGVGLPDHALPGGICAYIKVSDTGAGMDEDTQAKMWDPFFSTRSGGRGLGLAVVQGVVRAHGGVIQVVSQLGAGTTIQVALPAAQLAKRPGLEAPRRIRAGVGA